MHNITIDFNNPGLPQVIDVMQSDAQSRFIGLTLYDGGVPYSAPSGAVYTVEYHGPGPNNTGWYDTIQLSSGTRKAVVVSDSSPNVVTLELAEQALRVNGKVEVSLCVVNNTGYKLNTFPIICRVTGAPYVDPVSVRSYFYVTGLTSEQWTAYVTACQDAQKRAEDAAAKLVIDPTLTQEGQAADAKATGDAVGALKEDLNDVIDCGFESSYYSTHLAPQANVETQIHLYDNHESILYGNRFYSVQAKRISGSGIFQLDYISNLKRETIFKLSPETLECTKIIHISDGESVGILMYYCTEALNEFEITIKSCASNDIILKNPSNLIELHQYMLKSVSNEQIIPFFASLKKGYYYKFVIKSDSDLGQTDGSVSINDDSGSKIFEKTFGTANLSDSIEITYFSQNEINNTPVFLYFVNCEIGINVELRLLEYDQKLGYNLQKPSYVYFGNTGSTPFSIRHSFIKNKAYEVNVDFGNSTTLSMLGMYLSHYINQISIFPVIPPDKYAGSGFTVRFLNDFGEDFNYLTIRADSSTSKNIKISIKEIENVFDFSTISVSASNSTNSDKLCSNFVCTGENDEYIINMAVQYSSLRKKGIVRFANGLYHIQSFPFATPTISGKTISTAIVLPKNELELTLSGASCKYGFAYKMFDNGVRFYVDEIGYNSLLPDEQAAIIRSVCPESRVSGSAVKIYDIGLCTYGSQKKIIALDVTGVDRIYCERVNIVGYINEMLNDTNVGLNIPPIDIPVEGFVGVKMGTGSNDPQGYSFKNIGVWGFYEGFQVGGEHTVMEACSSTLCVYGYTFGNYEYGNNPNTIVHPITMINCCDERNQNFPLFKKCGYGQDITMIGFNVEQITSKTPGNVFHSRMKSEWDGFCGRIFYTIMTAYASDETGGNAKDAALWEDRSGSRFVCENMAQLKMGTTAERQTYAPNYHQQYYDTDLNKMLVCVDPIGKIWKDFNGNNII